MDATLSGGFTVAALTQVEEGRTTRVELYYSGAMCHIFPYHDNFITYQQLDPPLFLNAASGQQFPAVGTGSMVVSSPNGAGQSDITLENVLHAPSVGYTLVSLGLWTAWATALQLAAGTSTSSLALESVLHTLRGLNAACIVCHMRGEAGTQWKLSASWNFTGKWGTSHPQVPASSSKTA